MSDTKQDHEADEGFPQAIAGEMFAFATVFGSAWRVLRHPFTFKDHLTYKPKQTVRFFFVSAALVAFFSQIFFTTPGAEHTGFRIEDIALLHRLLPGLRSELQGEDIIPLVLLLFSVAAGLIVHGIWRCGRWLLSDKAKALLRNGPGIPGDRMNFSIGAFVYSVGVVVLAYALFAALAVIYPTAPSATSMAICRYLGFTLVAVQCYTMLIFMVGTPVWIARIYGVKIWALPVAGYATLFVLAMFILPVTPFYRDPPAPGKQTTLFSEHAMLSLAPASAKPVAGNPSDTPQLQFWAQGGLPMHYQSMLNQIFDAARSGDPGAETVLGWLCQTGWGVTCDPRLSESWFHKAADQGDADAANMLGVLILNRSRNDDDRREVFSLFSRAAGQGLAAAQSNLGLLYERGWGVPQDYDKAMEWYRKAADQGYAPAADHIGLLHLRGLGSQAHPADALDWFRKAANANNADAENNLGLAYFSGHGTSRSGQDAEAWFMKAVAQGYAQAEANLGWMYQHGVGAVRNDAQGRDLLERAAAQGVTAPLVSEITQNDVAARVGDRIFYAHASAAILPHAATVLLRQAEWLKQNPGATVTISGHTDGREAGSPEAALRLALQRAVAVRDFLVTEAGIASNRLRVLSYGKERPIVTGENEAAQQQNRVAVITID